VGIALWITVLTGHRLPSVEGLLQRLGFFIVLIWVLLIAVQLLRIVRFPIP
jgi:hypothetical protein